MLKHKMKEQQREKKIIQKNASGKKRKTGVSSQPKEVLPFSDDDNNGCMRINMNI